MNTSIILKQHPYPITQYADGRWKTYVKDSSKKNGRRQIAKRTKEEVVEEIIKLYKLEAKNESSHVLEAVYEEWLIWRKESGTTEKTLAENINEFNRFIRPSKLISKKINSISVQDIDLFFKDITKEYSITAKRLINIKSVLSGIFQYALLKGYTVSNPVLLIDSRIYKLRCKPTPRKKIYSLEEREQILKYLANSEHIADLAIQLDFCLGIRIGELTAIRKNDIQNDLIYIGRSQRKKQELQDDFSFGPVIHYIDERIKGNQTKGFRYLTLSSKAKSIINKTLSLYPDGDYLFMNNEKPLLPDTFNKRLKKVCTELSIEYRSSHTIRFTVATMLFDAGVTTSQLSTYLGHGDVQTTFHYVCQQDLNQESSNIIKNVLT